MASYSGQQLTADEATVPYSRQQPLIYQNKNPALQTSHVNVIPASYVQEAPMENRMDQLTGDMALSTVVQKNQDLQNTHGLYASQLQLFSLKREFESDLRLLNRRVNELEQQVRGLSKDSPAFEYPIANTENAIELADNQSTKVSSFSHDTEQTSASARNKCTIRPDESISVTDFVVSRRHKQNLSIDSSCTRTLSVAAAESADTSAETTSPRVEHSATNNSKAWKPAFISNLPPLSDKIAGCIPHLDQIETFSKSLLIQAFGDHARQYAPGIYWISRKVSSILPDRLFYILDEKIDPFLPGQPGEHGAKLTAFLSPGDDDDGPRLESYMNAPVFILKPDSNDDEQYIYYGMYSQTRLSDKLDYDRMQEIIPDHVKHWWAEQLGRRDRAPNVTEDLKNHFWPKPKYDGLTPSNLTEPMSNEVKLDAQGYIWQLAEWDNEDKMRVSLIETKDILDAFDRPDCSEEPGLRLYWEYLECVNWDRGFYDMLVNMKRSKGDIHEDFEPTRLSAGQSAQRGNCEETAPHDPTSLPNTSNPKSVQRPQKDAEERKNLISGAPNIGAPRVGGVANSGPKSHKELKPKLVESDDHHGPNEANTGRKAKCIEAPRETDAISQVSSKPHEKVPNIIPPHLRVRGPHTALEANPTSGTTDGGQDTPPQIFARLVPLQSSEPPPTNTETANNTGRLATETSSMAGNPANRVSSIDNNTSTSDEDGGVLIGICYTSPDGGESSPGAGTGAQVVSKRNQSEDSSSPSTPRTGNIMISYVPPASTVSSEQKIDVKTEGSKAPPSDLSMRTEKGSESSSPLSTSTSKKRRLSFGRAGAHKPPALDLTIQGSTCGGSLVRLNPSMCSVSTAAGTRQTNRPSPRQVLTEKRQEKQKEQNKQEDTPRKKSVEIKQQATEKEVANQPHLTIVPLKDEPKLFNPRAAAQMQYGTEGRTRSEVAKMRKKAIDFAPYMTATPEGSAPPYPSRGNASPVMTACSSTAGPAVGRTASVGVKRKQGTIETMKVVKKCLSDTSSADTFASADKVAMSGTSGKLDPSLNSAGVNTPVPAIEANTSGTADEVIVSTPVNETEASIPADISTVTTTTAPSSNHSKLITKRVATSTPAACDPTTIKALTAADKPKATPSILKGPDTRKPSAYMGPLSRYDKEICSRRASTTNHTTLSRTINPSTRTPTPQASAPRPSGEKVTTDMGQNMELSSPALGGGLEASRYAHGRVTSTRMMH